MIRSLLEQHSQDCGLEAIHNETALDKVWRTSLPWTASPGALVWAENEKYLRVAAQNPNVAAMVIPPLLLPYAAEAIARGACVLAAEKSADLYFLAHLAKLHSEMAEKRPMLVRQIDPTAKIHPTAVIAERVQIGRNTQIGPYAVIGENCRIDEDCYVGAHAVLAEGAFFPRQILGRLRHIPHFGGLSIGRRCRIQAQSVISASSYFGEFTELKDDVILGFQTIVGHDAILGQGCNLSSKALVAGRTVLGKNVSVCASASISNTLEIGDNAEVAFGAAVIDNVPAGAKVSGNFAIPHHKNLRHKAELQCRK